MPTKSMAVWAALRDSSGAPRMEAHFNFWRVAGDDDFRGQNGSSPRDFLEIGLMVTAATAINKISIFLPITINSSDIEDCGHKFIDLDIAQGIFNEILSSSHPASPAPPCVELYKSGKIYCRVYNFSLNGSAISSNELTISRDDGHTILSIEAAAIDRATAHLPDDARVYFRLRIYLNQDNHILKVISPKDKFLLSGFEQIEYIDFRLNEARTLPNTVETIMNNDQRYGRVIIELVAFLTAVPIRCELAASNIQAYKNRLLEHQVWNQYVNGGIPDGMMVYHWKRQASRPKEADQTAAPGDVDSIKDFSAFVKLQTRRSSWQIVLTYVSVAFVSGLLGNLAANVIWELAK